MAPLCKLEKDIPSSRHFPPIFGKTIIMRTNIHDASSGKGASSGCAVHNLHAVQRSRSPSDGRDHGAWRQVSSLHNRERVKRKLEWVQEMPGCVCQILVGVLECMSRGEGSKLFSDV